MSVGRSSDGRRPPTGATQSSSAWRTIFAGRFRNSRGSRSATSGGCVGFWTPDYLSEKLARLRQASPPAFVLCIDEERACAPSELPPGLPVVTFRRRVDAAAVMREVERLTAGAGHDAPLRSSG
jgi:hypothetical protein